MHSLHSFIDKRKNNPDKIVYNKDKKYKFNSEFATAFIVDTNTKTILWSEAGQTHNDILFYVDDDIKEKMGLDDVLFVDEIYSNKDYSKHIKCGRIWVIPNNKSKNRKYDVYIAWWQELTNAEFNTLNKFVITDYNKKHNTDIKSYMIVDNNGVFKLIAFDEEIKIDPQSEVRKDDMQILFAIHLANSEEKRKYLSNWLKDRNKHNQERLYNKTKSKTAAEYNHIKTIGDSLEIKNNYILKRNMKSLIDFILEAQKITFGGSGASKENYGNCIILAGGPGSGKGFIKSKILCQYKNVDVDELKKQYIKLAKAGKIAGDSGDYDIKNPDDTSTLHGKVKDHKWKSKQREAFWKQRNMNDEHSSGLLPNILFDMVSGDIKDIEEVVVKAKEMGYTTTIIWVLCNKETASIGNKIRERMVHDKIIDTGHADAYKTMSELFSNKYPEVTKLIDRGWIGFSAGYGRHLLPEYENEPVIKVKGVKEDKFTLNKSLIDKFLKDKMPIDYKAIKNNLSSDKEKVVKQVKDWIKIVGDEYQPNNVNESVSNYQEEYIQNWTTALQEIL